MHVGVGAFAGAIWIIKVIKVLEDWLLQYIHGYTAEWHKWHEIWSLTNVIKACEEDNEQSWQILPTSQSGHARDCHLCLSIFTIFTAVERKTAVIISTSFSHTVQRMLSENSSNISSRFSCACWLLCRLLIRLLMVIMVTWFVRLPAKIARVYMWTALSELALMQIFLPKTINSVA